MDFPIKRANGEKNAHFFKKVTLQGTNSQSPAKHQQRSRACRQSRTHAASGPNVTSSMDATSGTKTTSTSTSTSSLPKLGAVWKPFGGHRSKTVLRSHRKRRAAPPPSETDRPPNPFYQIRRAFLHASFARFNQRIMSVREHHRHAPWTTETVLSSNLSMCISTCWPFFHA